MKLDELLRARGLKRVDAAKATGYDKPMISRLTTGYCLPNTQKLATLCELLDCGVLDLYERGEVDLLKCGRKGSGNAVATREKRNASTCWKFTVRVPNSLREQFTDKVIRAAGYPSYAAWLCSMMQQTIEKATLPVAADKVAKNKK